MMRRAVAVIAWLVVATMNALWVWTILWGGFLDVMFEKLTAEGQAQLTPGMVAVTYGAMAGILVVTLSYATVGSLLALRRGGGRMGAILLVGSAAFAAVPFGYAFGGTMALRNPNDPIPNVLVLFGPALVPFGYALILPIVALTFPDGHLPSSRWRLPSRVALGALAAATMLLQSLLGDVIQGQTVAVAGSTLLAAALFQPLRRRVQAAVDHRFNRGRYDGDQTTAAFAERLREQVDLAGLEADFAGVVDNALRPASIGVWIRPPEQRGTA